MDRADESAQSRQKDKRNQYQDEGYTHHNIVNEERQESQPESCVLHARYGGVSGIRGNGRRATFHRRRNRCTQYRRPSRHCRRKPLPAIRAKRRTIRHRRAAVGTVHGVSSFLFSLARTRRNRSQILLSSRHRVNPDRCRSFSLSSPSHRFTFAAWSAPTPGRLAPANLQPAVENQSLSGSISSVGDAEFSMEVQKNQDVKTVQFLVDDNTKVEGKLAVGAQARVEYHSNGD